MRKVITCLLSAVLMLCLAACQNESKKSDDNSYSEFLWPKNETADLLPMPESNIGRVIWETSDGFMIYVGETSKKQYDSYVNECREKGFTVDYKKGDNYFYAYNDAGYDLSLIYTKDRNTMSVCIKKPEESVLVDEKIENVPIFEENSAELTEEVFFELSYYVPSNWRKEVQGNSGFFFYPTNNDTDGFLYVGIRKFDNNMPDNFDEKKDVLKNHIEKKSGENLIRNEYIEYDLQIAGCYAIKNYSVWEDYDCLYYYILTDYGFYLVGIDIYKTSPSDLEQILESVINNIIINKAVDQSSNIEVLPQKNIVSEKYALRAAVVAFANFFAEDIWADDGNEVETSLLHSFADVSGDVSKYFMFILSEGTWTEKNENTWHVGGLQLERYTKFLEKKLSFSITINVSLDVSYDGENYIISNLLGKTTNHDSLEWMEEDKWNVRTYLIVPQRLVEDDRDVSKVEAMDCRSGRKADISTAQRAFENVGKELFPYGFKVSWWSGLEESVQAHDGSWYLRARVTITNQYGASREAIADAVINNTTESVDGFNVY